jgi:hypothetical protein
MFNWRRLTRTIAGLAVPISDSRLLCEVPIKGGAAYTEVRGNIFAGVAIGLDPLRGGDVSVS